MIAAGQVYQNILEAIHRTQDDSMTKRVWRLINQKYFDICRQWPWNALRRSPLELEFGSASDDTGLYLPSNLFGIQRVRDDENDFEFLPRDMADAIEPDDDGYRYYRYQPSQSDAFMSFDLELNPGDEGTDTIISDSLTTDYTGDFCRFGSAMGFYELTAIKTFTPKYRGESVVDEVLRIRPKETEKLVILDPEEDVLRDRTVKVYYWVAPEPLYLESDMIVLPLSRALELMVLAAMPEAKERRPVSQREVEEAMKDIFKLNPDFPRQSKPRDKHNATFAMKNRLFARRNGTTVVMPWQTR